MPEREPMNPEVARALRAYEVEMRDGTERSQKEAFRQLQIAQRALAALAIMNKDKAAPEAEAGEAQLAS